jgi:hypothetical protein
VCVRKGQERGENMEGITSTNVKMYQGRKLYDPFRKRHGDGGGGVRDEDGQGNEKESQKRLGFHDSKVLKTMGHS